MPGRTGTGFPRHYRLFLEKQCKKQVDYTSLVNYNKIIMEFSGLSCCAVFEFMGGALK